MAANPGPRRQLMAACIELHRILERIRANHPDGRYVLEKESQRNDIATSLRVLLDSKGRVDLTEDELYVVQSQLTQDDVDTLVKLIRGKMTGKNTHEFDERSFLLHVGISTPNKILCEELTQLSGKVKEQKKLSEHNKILYAAGILLTTVKREKEFKNVWEKTEKLKQFLADLGSAADRCEALNTKEGDNFGTALFRLRAKICENIMQHANELLDKVKNPQEMKKIYANPAAKKKFMSALDQAQARCQLLESKTGNNLANALSKAKDRMQVAFQPAKPSSAIVSKLEIGAHRDGPNLFHHDKLGNNSPPKKPPKTPFRP